MDRVVAMVRHAALALVLVGSAGCGVGPTELMLILAIVVVLFGASRLPALGKALGETVKNFRDHTQAGLKGEKDEAQAKLDEQPATGEKGRLTKPDPPA